MSNSTESKFVEAVEEFVDHCISGHIDAMVNHIRQLEFLVLGIDSLAERVKQRDSNTKTPCACRFSGPTLAREQVQWCVVHAAMRDQLQKTLEVSQQLRAENERELVRRCVSCKKRAENVKEIQND